MPCCGLDKNQHRLEEADVRFKEIQNAYEVLTDKHERAWWVLVHQAGYACFPPAAGGLVMLVFGGVPVVVFSVLPHVFVLPADSLVMR